MIKFNCSYSINPSFTDEDIYERIYLPIIRKLEHQMRLEGIENFYTRALIDFISGDRIIRINIYEGNKPEILKDLWQEIYFDENHQIVFSKNYRFSIYR